MAMIELSWREAQEGELPPVCAKCGEPADEWVERYLQTMRPGFFVFIRSSAIVTLPYCRAHVAASWIGWERVRAQRIRQDAIVLRNVAEEFADAVEDFRRRPEAWGEFEEPPRRPRRDQRTPLPGLLPGFARILMFLLAALFVMAILSGFWVCSMVKQIRHPRRGEAPTLFQNSSLIGSAPSSTEIGRPLLSRSCSAGSMPST